MAERHHDFTTVERGGKTFSAATIRCSVEGCGEHDELVNTNQRRLSPDQCTLKWKRIGWFVGRNAGRDLCPDHNKKQKGNAMSANGRNHGGAGRTIGEIYKDEPAVPANTRQVLDTHSVDKGGVVTMLPSERMRAAPGLESDSIAPRVMDREEKRILFGELDAAYQDAEHGYKAGHSDKSVADALGVPIVWVRQLREEMFGPAEGDKTIKELAALLERQIALETSINEAKDLLASLLKEAQSISIRLTDLKAKKG